MRLPRRDALATGLVAVAGVLYGLWVFDLASWGMTSIRIIGMAILALGFLASASAVVPGFEELIRGNRLYLVITTLMGLAALAGGLWMLVASSETGLSLLMGTLGGLWLVTTVHHSLLAPAASERATLAEIRPFQGKEAA